MRVQGRRKHSDQGKDLWRQAGPLNETLCTFNNLIVRCERKKARKRPSDADRGCVQLPRHRDVLGHATTWRLRDKGSARCPRDRRSSGILLSLKAISPPKICLFSFKALRLAIETTSKIDCNPSLLALLAWWPHICASFLGRISFRMTSERRVWLKCNELN